MRKGDKNFLDFSILGSSYPHFWLIFPIFNPPSAEPVFVNLNSQVFFVPRPTLPKSQTVFSKEILGDRLLASGAGFGEIACGIEHKCNITRIRISGLCKLTSGVVQITCSLRSAGPACITNL